MRNGIMDAIDEGMKWIREYDGWGNEIIDGIK